MAESIWQAGRLKQVMFTVGVRENGERRYAIAPFDILSWKPTSTGTEDTWVVPVSIEGVDAKSLNRTGLQDEQSWGEFGYYDLAPVVIEPHQGDGSDSLVGLHSFGVL